jgi:CRP-like cAMP-binding protein
LLETLFLHLERHDVVSNYEKSLLSSAMVQTRHISTGQDLVTSGTRPPHSVLLVDGFAARYKLLVDGSRQISALHVTGDFVDLHVFLLRTIDHGVMAMSPCQVAYAGHDDLKRITEEAPHLTRLLWLSTIVDGAIHREWLVAMGRRSKKSQLAHLICELFVRLRAVQRVDGWSFRLPLSQTSIADVLGLSVVHVNRVIQGLRREGLITWVNQIITILDWDRLVEVAEFDPTYLSLRNEPR